MSRRSSPGVSCHRQTASLLGMKSRQADQGAATRSGAEGTEAAERAATAPTVSCLIAQLSYCFTSIPIISGAEGDASGLRFGSVGRVHLGQGLHPAVRQDASAEDPTRRTSCGGPGPTAGATAGIGCCLCRGRRKGKETTKGARGSTASRRGWRERR